MITMFIQNYLTEILKTKIKRISSVSGGDISEAFLVESSNHRFFLKVNSKPQATKMFINEKMALDIISQTKTIATPKIHAVKHFSNEKGESQAFLLMDYIESKRPDPKDLEKFGGQLAALHQISNPNFGWGIDNFIGSLPQLNSYKDSWSDFYWNERLMPQFDLATSKKLLSYSTIPTFENWEKFARNNLSNIQPSLLHGDLWSGNYLISTDGIPYLIDPATYFGHSEVDIAMSKLFGDFGNAFYESYFQSNPAMASISERMDLYQLYYLLVHLNLFGRSYLGSVLGVLKKYFSVTK